jgi:hypothetical protein
MCAAPGDEEQVRFARPGCECRANDRLRPVDVASGKPGDRLLAEGDHLGGCGAD